MHNQDGQNTSPTSARDRWVWLDWLLYFVLTGAVFLVIVCRGTLPGALWWGLIGGGAAVLYHLTIHQLLKRWLPTLYK
jgi:hypothetical protein